MVQSEPGGAFVQNAGAVLNATPVFRWQHAASLNWRQGSWSGVLVNRFKSGSRYQARLLEHKELTSTGRGF